MESAGDGSRYGALQARIYGWQQMSERPLTKEKGFGGGRLSFAPRALKTRAERGGCSTRGGIAKNQFGDAKHQVAKTRLINKAAARRREHQSNPDDGGRLSGSCLLHSTLSTDECENSVGKDRIRGGESRSWRHFGNAEVNRRCLMVVFRHPAGAL